MPQQKAYPSKPSTAAYSLLGLKNTHKSSSCFRKERESHAFLMINPYIQNHQPKPANQNAPGQTPPGCILICRKFKILASLLLHFTKMSVWLPILNLPAQPTRCRNVLKLNCSVRFCFFRFLSQVVAGTQGESRRPSSRSRFARAWDS
jgi:hypothetical protein